MKAPSRVRAFGHLYAAAMPLFLLSLVGCGRPQSKAFPTLPPPPLNDGTTSSGGGDSIELEVKLIGRSLDRRLRDRNPKVYTESNFSLWLARLEQSSVVGVNEQTYHNGRPVDALNFPAPCRINIYNKRWPLLNAWERERLVLHEVFGLAGMIDRGYKLTDSILQSLGFHRLARITSIALDGPTASSLVENLDWTGADVILLPQLLQSASGHRHLVSLTHQKELFLHCLGTTSVKLNSSIQPKERLRLENPVCLLNMDGFLKDNSLEFGRTQNEDPKGQGKFAELWRRLALAGEEFNFPSISGSFDKESERYEIRMHLESKR